MIDTTNIREQSERQISKYNGDYDTAIGSPYMTHADFVNIELICKMIGMIEDLQRQMNDLREEV